MSIPQPSLPRAGHFVRPQNLSFAEIFKVEVGWHLEVRVATRVGSDLRFGANDLNGRETAAVHRAVVAGREKQA